MKLSLKERLGYGLGTAGEQLPNFLVQAYLFGYFNLVVGLDAGVIATIMLVARVWDAVYTPIVGAISDRTRTRWGSYRPYAFFATLPLTLFLVLTFTEVGFTEEGKVGYCGAMYILYVMSGTTSLIPLGSLANVLTDDSQERAVLATFKEMGSSLGNLTGSIVIPLVVTFFINIGIGESKGYQLTAIVLGLACILFVGITFCSTRERIEPPKGEGNLFKSFLVLKGNIPGVCIILYLFFISTAIIFRQMFNNMYYGPFVLGDTALGNRLMVLMALAPFFILYFIPKITAKYGKKNQLILGCWAILLGGVLFFAAGTSPVLNMLSSFVVGLGQVLTFSGVWSAIPDTADYGTYVNGISAPGAMFALANFGMKMGMTMASTLMGWSLTLVGFDQTSSVQAEGVVAGLQMFNALSLIIPSLLGILILIPYKLTAAKSEEVRRTLAQRRKTTS